MHDKQDDLPDVYKHNLPSDFHKVHDSVVLPRPVLLGTPGNNLKAVLNGNMITVEIVD